MALREERSGRNQQAWHSRFERERQDLSASVQAALVDDSGLEEQWQDEADDQEGSRRSSTSNTTLVPPRLSLQSKMLPAVRSDGPVATTSNSHPVVEAKSMAEEKPEPEAPVQNTGMLARIAQRFTSSFAAIGGTPKPGPARRPGSSTPTRETQPGQNTGDHMLAASHREAHQSSESIAASMVRVMENAPLASSVVESSGHGKQRSLRHNGKVRLETAEMHVIPRIPTIPDVEEQETGESMLSSEVREALVRQKDIRETGRHENVSAPLSVLQTFDGELGSGARGALSGSGAFEGGQSDTIIDNVRITAASVVLVTLTSNPGPVVVQYISLRPGIGFTVHLTAPVNTRTTFNYVVLLGELF